MESHGEQADCYHAGTAHNAGRHAAQPGVHACKVGQAAEHAGRGVYLLAKDERLDVDEHVAEHSADTANPMVSKRNHVLFWRMSALPNTATQSTAKAVHTTYVGVCIQNGVSPSIKSRTVPPPTAVVKPTTYAPNKSKRLADAKRMPEMAKANVPIKSRTCEKLGKSIGHVKFNIYLLGTKRKSR